MRNASLTTPSSTPDNTRDEAARKQYAGRLFFLSIPSTFYQICPLVLSRASRPRLVLRLVGVSFFLFSSYRIIRADTPTR